jgi:hypothetical protein
LSTRKKRPESPVPTARLEHGCPHFSIESALHTEELFLFLIVAISQLR